MNADYFSTLKADSKPKYGQKLDIVGLKDCPFHLPADIWCDIHTVAYDYLINTPGSYI